MKLVTDVTPRGDGTVSATVGATKYLFKASDDGRLTADVASEADALFLLDTGNFYPATEDDSPIVTTAVTEAEVARRAEVARLEAEEYAKAEAEAKAAEEAEASAKAEAKAKKDQAAADAKAAKAEAKKATK